MLKHGFFILLVSLIFIGCKDEPVHEVVLPTGLSLQLEESETVEGKVTATATAMNANFYSFVFYTSDSDSTVLDADGNEAEFTYTESGTYKVVARAHTTYEEYASVSNTIDIDIYNPGGGGSDTSMAGYTTPDNYDGYTLVWRDEFDGTSLNESDWNFEIGTGAGGWGNNELQYYLKENTSVENGVLTITAKEQIYNASNYTSSRITTQGKKSFKYGRVDIRARLPYGKGLWPALWMLGENISTVGWPACGEIDIMEMVGGANSDNTVHGTAHWEQNGHANYGGSNKLPSGIFAHEYHVFSIIWDAQQIRWYRDDILYQTIDITPSALSEFHEDHFFIFNVAVGGNWPGSPNASTTFPQTMKVDYIRVFQK